MARERRANFTNVSPCARPASLSLSLSTYAMSASRVCVGGCVLCAFCISSAADTTRKVCEGDELYIHTEEFSAKFDLPSAILFHLASSLLGEKCDWELNSWEKQHQSKVRDQRYLLFQNLHSWSLADGSSVRNRWYKILQKYAHANVMSNMLTLKKIDMEFRIGELWIKLWRWSKL